jgi:hypothetical protein
VLPILNVKAGNDRRKALAQHIVSVLQNNAQQGPGANALASFGSGGSGAAPGLQRAPGGGGSPRLTFSPRTPPGLMRLLGPGGSGQAGVGETENLAPNRGVGNSVAARAMAAAMVAGVGAHGMPAPAPAVQPASGVGMSSVNPMFAQPGQPGTMTGPGGGTIWDPMSASAPVNATQPGVGHDTLYDPHAADPSLIHLGGGVYYNPAHDSVVGTPVGGINQWFR